jgi:hypothetical protein
MINDDFEIILKLVLFASNIKRDIHNVLSFFFLFKERCEKKTHNMLYLMLNF